jgi:formate hydrogenlyase transcriptional activator
VTEVAEEVLHHLKRLDWPGNVRELQNVIERAVILSSGARLDIPIEALRASSCWNEAMTQTLAEAQRSHILGVLEQTNGVISGPNGAACRLGLPRTTLMYRMRTLGIVQRRTFLGRPERGPASNSRRASRSDRDGIAVRRFPC